MAKNERKIEEEKFEAVTQINARISNIFHSDWMTTTSIDLFESMNLENVANYFFASREHETRFKRSNLAKREFSEGVRSIWIKNSRLRGLLCKEIIFSLSFVSRDRSLRLIYAMMRLNIYNTRISRRFFLLPQVN